jgi:predicted nuclease of predicted toxin-antitoxin system
MRTSQRISSKLLLMSILTPRTFRRLASTGQAIGPSDRAAADGFVLVTKDQDFHRLSVLVGPPSKVIWIRLCNSTTADMARLLRFRAGDVRAFAEETAESQHKRSWRRELTGGDAQLLYRWRAMIEEEKAAS